MSNVFNELKSALNEDEEIETPELLDQEEVVEEPEEDENEESVHMEKFSAMLRQSVAEEHEAAAIYTKRAAKCEKHGMEDAAKIFRDIAEEELVHVGEFQALMEKYGFLNQEAIDQGEKEAEEILSGEKVEPEIDAEESLNEEFLDTSEIHGRLLRLFDYGVEDRRAVDLLKMIAIFLDVDQFQKFYEYVQEELDMNYNEIFGLKATEESVNEARGPIVHAYKKDVGNINLIAKSLKDALSYVKKKLDLQSGDHFSIHSGNNTSTVDGLEAWGGTNNYWARVLDDPKTKARDKEIIKSKEIKSLDEIFEDGRDVAAKMYLDYKNKYNSDLDKLADAYNVTKEKAQSAVVKGRSIVDNELILSEFNSQDSETDAFLQRQMAADNSPTRYVVKSLLDGEKDLEPREFTERQIRNIYASYLMDQYETGADIPFGEIQDRAWSASIEEIIEFLNQQGDAEVSIKTEDAVSAGTIASAGETPTVVAGDGVVQAEPTKMCEEFKALLEALEN